MKIIFRFLTSAEKPMEIMDPFFKRHVISITKGDANFLKKFTDLF